MFVFYALYIWGNCLFLFPLFRKMLLSLMKYKILIYLLSLDRFLPQNVVVVVFNQILRWRSFSHFYSPGKSHKNSFSTYLTYIYIHSRVFHIVVYHQVRMYHGRNFNGKCISGLFRKLKLHLMKLSSSTYGTIINACLRFVLQIDMLSVARSVTI